MEIFLAGIFWLTIALLVHTYINYPLTLWIIALFKGKPIKLNPGSLPSISILISAYNEEKVIDDRIENIRNLNYDFNKVELIIGSDCSSDATNEILIQKSNNYSWIKTQIYTGRRGKANVLNDLAQIAENEILVFTDANTKFEKDALINLVSNFTNQNVGGVCGRLILEEPKDDFDKTNREKLYWKYETQLKKLEGKSGILIAANGGIYAIRKNLFIKFPADKAITDDLYQTFAVLNQEYNFLYAFDAVAIEEVSKEIGTEFRRKVRFASTNFQTVIYFKKLLFGNKFILSYVLYSHKVLRWFVPVIGILLFLSSLLLINSGRIYNSIFIIQCAFYFAAFIGFIFNLLKINASIFSIIYYYILTNLALLFGFINFLFGKQRYTWDSTPR